MSLRKWLVRSLVFAVMAGATATSLLYMRWTNPAAVRLQVLAALSERFIGANLNLESASMRLLGGISVSDLRMARKENPERCEIAHFPSATIFHDKEQLLHGILAFRKIELDRPRFHIVRDPQGNWNVKGLLAPPDPKVPVPTILIRQGTLLFEDQLCCPGQPALELSQVNLTLINDPATIMNFQGSGTSALTGPIRISGSWNRQTNETTVAFQASKIPVDTPLIKRIESYCSQAGQHAHDLKGIGSFQGELSYNPANPTPWTHDLRWQLSQGKLSHPQIPIPLDQLEISIRCQDGLVKLDKATARAGVSRLELSGTAQRPHPDTDFKGTLTLTGFSLTPELFDKLPPNLKKLQEDFSPTGTVNLVVHASRQAGRWNKHFVVQVVDVAVTCAKFRYPAEHLKGTVEQTLGGENRPDETRIDLAGLAGGKKIFIKGQVIGEAPYAAMDVKIWGHDIVLDQKLEAALPPAQQKLARSFKPTGLADFEANMVRGQGEPNFRNTFRIRFHHASACFDPFPYPLEDVSGILEIFPEYWEFHDFRGTHKGGEVRTRGRCQTGQPDRFDIEVLGQKVLLDQDLKAALNNDLKAVWDMFTPAGHMNFLAHVECLPQKPPDIEVTVTPAGCTVKPTFFPYTFNQLSGDIHYAKGWIRLEKIRARHGETIMTLEKGDACLKQGGGVWAQLVNVQGGPLIVDDDLLAALPPMLRTGCEVLHLKGPVGLTTELTIESRPSEKTADIFWDGELRLRESSLAIGIPVEKVTGKAACRGRFNGKQLEDVVGNIFLDEATLFNQPFHDIQSQIRVVKNEPNVLMFPGLRGRVFGGEIYGPARVDFDLPVKYELNLTASNIKLEEFGQHNLGADPKVSGMTTGRLYLAGKGQDIKELKGRGSLDVPKGKLYNLPLLLDLLKVLGLHLPDGTAFEEAHAQFQIQGPRVVVDRFDLFGNLISLRGQGDMNLDGTNINLDFYAVWARVMQMLPPIIKEIPRAISKELLRIKMRGRIGDVHCTKEPVPSLVDPLKDFLEAVGGRR